MNKLPPDFFAELESDHTPFASNPEHFKRSLKSLTVVFPTFQCREYAEIVIKSFERFKPSDLEIEYVVVENSHDDSYKDQLEKISDRVKWIQNPLQVDRWPANAMHSYANAAGVARGIQEVKTDWVFVAHSDVCVTSASFFDELKKRVALGDVLIGTVRDNSRAFAIHVSGYLTKTSLAKQIDFFPEVAANANSPIVSIILDVGDRLDLLCQQLGLKTFCYANTENDKHMKCEGIFEQFHVDRCVDSDGKVMFMHLGRGADKMAGRYNKQGRILRDEWITFCQRFI